MRRTMIRLSAMAAAGLLIAGCGGDEPADEDPEATATDTEDASDEADDADEADEADDAADDGMDDDMDMDEDMDMSGSYGEPAEASEAERTIEVEVDNELVFKPDEFEVAAGEVVTFQIANTGDLEHEFVLGDEEAQEQMAEEMAEMAEEDGGHAHSGEMSNAVTIHPGEEAELTWRFPEEPTTVLVGCHVDGHYDGGMQGTVTVG